MTPEAKASRIETFALAVSLDRKVALPLVSDRTPPKLFFDRISRLPALRLHGHLPEKGLRVREMLPGPARWGSLHAYGLDAYLDGLRDFDAEEQKRHVGKEGELISFAYWRKNWKLHEYIVKEFADGVDECQPIILNRNDLERIVLEQKENAAFQQARDWLSDAEVGKRREIVYQASW